MPHQRFQTMLQIGGLVLLVSLLVNFYLLIQHWQLTREMEITEQQRRELTARQRSLEGVLREFIARAPADPQIAAVLVHHQLIAPPPAPDEPAEPGEPAETSP
jgi:hypothetical protein